MKKTIILSVLLMTITTVVRAQSSTSLIAQWTFNGNVNDATTNGHHGTEYNITYGAGKAGGSNTAAVFDGSSSFISVPSSNDFNVTKYTAYALFKITNFYNGPCQGNVIFQRGQQHTAGCIGLNFSDNYFDNDCNVKSPNNYYLGLEAGAGNATIPNTHWSAGTALTANTWYCVVATYDSAAVKIYINGVLSATGISGSGPFNIGTSNDSLVIGANRWGAFAQAPYWFNGLIDELRIYNGVLTEEEIASFCDVATSVQNVAEREELSLYPNPNNGQFTLKGNVVAKEYISYQIVNMLGSTVYNGTAKVIDGVVNERMNITNLPSGAYLMQIQGLGTQQALRLIVQ